MKLTFCLPACCAAACRKIVNKFINFKKLVARSKIVSPCCADQDRLRNVQRSHSPFEFEPLEGGGMGGPLCWSSVAILVVSCVFFT